MDLVGVLSLSGIAVLIGAAVGATGIGGFLLIPALWLMLDMPLRDAMGTTLVASAANGALATCLFARRGSVPWRMAMPLCAGALVCAFVGGMLNAIVSTVILAKLLGGVIVVGSAYILMNRGNTTAREPTGGALLLLGIGLVSGLIAGLTGAGGPLISVPLMTVLHFPYLATVGASQVLQLVASASGAVAYWQHGAVSFAILAVIIPFQLLGIWGGVRLAHWLDVVIARRALAIAGVLIGSMLIVF